MDEIDTTLQRYHMEAARSLRLFTRTQQLKAQRDLLLKAVQMALEDLRNGRPDLVRAGLDGALLCIDGGDK